MIQDTTIEQYLREKCTTDNPRSLQSYGNRLRKLQSEEKLLEKSCMTFNKQDWVQLFTKYNWSAPNIFNPNKSLFLSFLYWYEFRPEQQAAPPGTVGPPQLALVTRSAISPNETLNTEYFASSNDYYSAIDTIYFHNEAAHPDIQRFLMDISYFTLVFEGIPPKFVPTIHVKNIEPEIETISIDAIKYKIQEPRAWKIIKATMLADSYTLPRGEGMQCARQYANTGMLLRPATKAAPGTPISKNTVYTYTKHQRQLSEALGQDKPYSGKVFSAVSLRYSGAFCRLYQIECDSQSDISTAEAPLFKSFYEQFAKIKLPATISNKSSTYKTMHDLYTRYADWRCYFHQ